MKVLLVNANPFEGGFSGRTSEHLIEYLKKKGCEPVIFNQYEQEVEYGKSSIRQFSESDSSDETEYERKLLMCDGIIVMCPVYLRQVPGEFKITLDRFSYRMHEFPLVGKRLITVAYGNSNGAEDLNYYLRTIFTAAGAEAVASEIYYKVNGDESAVITNLEKDIDYMLECYEKKFFQITKRQEELFRFYKAVVKAEKEAGVQSSKQKGWEKLIQYDSLSDYVQNELICV